MRHIATLTLALFALPSILAAQPSAPTSAAPLGSMDLWVTGSCPGQLTLHVANATPGALVVFGFDILPGSLLLPSGVCAGTVIGLANPQLGAILPADGSGNLTVPLGFLPGTVCQILIQALDTSTCNLSSVVSLTPVSSVDHAFPSASSLVISSSLGGFVDAEACGPFEASHHQVLQVLAGPPSLTGLILVVDVLANTLVAPDQVDWQVLVNGVVVDAFAVQQGDTTVARSVSFPAIAGPTYTVVLDVLNDLPPSAGAHQLRYAGVGSHQLTLMQ